MEFLKPSFVILKKFYHDPGKNLKLILSRELEKIADHKRHQAITRTVYEVTRNHHLLTYIVRQRSQRELDKIQPDIFLFLKIGAYLLLFSRSYPDYAIVNEVVNAVNGNAKSFVNAMLRNIAKNKTFILNEIENIQLPDIAYSVAGILIENLKLISPHLEQDLKYLNMEPWFHIRVNQKETSYTETRQFLADNKISFKELGKFNSFEIKESGLVINQLLEKRQFYFQNTGSQIISIIASRFAHHIVLDCCAAPGTKSVTLSLLNPQLTIYANDINPKRETLLKDFLNQYQLTRIIPLVSDIKHLNLKKDIDLVIVDAPCTSAGTLRKNPDLKIKIDNELINKNAQNQLEIMESVITCFSKAGYILYSVCSFVRQETEEIMEKLCLQHSLADRFAWVDLGPILEEFGFLFKRGKYGYYLLPNPDLNNDLFYISLLKKTDPLAGGNEI